MANRYLLEVDGQPYRACLVSGVVVPTIPLLVNEFVGFLWPDGWSLLTS